MRTTPLLAAAVVLAFAGAAAPAHSGPPNDAETRGGCFFETVDDPTRSAVPPHTWAGTVGAAVVAYSPTLGHDPVEVEVWCDVVVNRLVVGSMAARGFGAAAHAVETVYTADEDDMVEICTWIDTYDAHNQHGHFDGCAPVTAAEVLPGAVFGAADTACALAGDRLPCDVLRAVAPRHRSLSPGA